VVIKGCHSFHNSRLLIQKPKFCKPTEAVSVLTTIDFWHQEKDAVPSYKQSILYDCVDDSSVLKVTFDAHTHGRAFRTHIQEQ